MSRRRPTNKSRAGSAQRPVGGMPLGLILIGLVVGVVVVVAAVVLVAGGGTSTADAGFTAVPNGYAYPVQAIPRNNDRHHFAVGQTYTGYNSNPPTSGPHAATPAQWGISDLAIAKEQALHNEEHGGVVVWYNCNAQPVLSSDDCTQLRNQLSSVVSPELAGGKFVLMTPYSDMDHRIALTAWGFLDAFDQFDQARVKDFIDTFVCNFNVEHFCP